MPRLIQRHDQFFKRLLDQPGAAGALLRERLPPEVVRQLAPEPPELLPGSFVPAELREYRTDRLYRVRMLDGRPPLYIHAVVEHKSAPDPRVGLQLLGYKTQILEWWDRTEGRGEGGALRPLPAVLSVVVYHGQAEWQVPLSLAAAVDAGEALRPWLADFQYVLVDVGRIDDISLSANAVLRVGFLILKYGSRTEDLRATLSTLGRAALALGFDDLLALIRYILWEPTEVEASILREVLAEIMPGQEEQMMSLAAQQLKAEWQAQAKTEILLRQLRHRFGDLAPMVEARIQAADSEQLDTWLDQLMYAGSVSEIFPADPSH